MNFQGEGLLRVRCGTPVRTMRTPRPLSPLGLTRVQRTAYQRTVS
jgi:hypothetical protein